MLKKFRARFSSAHVLAGLALFVALGGSAYALKKNTVGTKQIKNNAVKEAKIANGAVTTPKLADNAATGAKVDEASLGKVPSATNADKATSADKATTADSATSATLAADSDLLSGLDLQQVRPLGNGATSTTDVNLPSAAFAQVISDQMAIPPGGASVIVNATVELHNNGAAARNAECVVRSDGVDISQDYSVQSTLPSVPIVLTLTAFADFPATALGDPENIGVFCEGSVNAGDMEFLDGDLAIERIPG
jgi:hypothetical protein